MFYIEKLNKLSRREITSMHIAPAVLVFLAFFAITLWNWVQARHSLDRSTGEALTKNVDTVQGSIIKNFDAYENILSATTGLFDASDYVDKGEWNKFINIFDIQGDYGGIKSIGFSKVLPRQDLNDYIEKVRSREGIKLNVQSSAAQFYAPVIYSQQADDRENSAAGYDMYANEQMRAAMAEARDSGEPALSGHLLHTKDNPFAAAPTVMLYSPIYARGSQTDTVKQRRQNIWGYVYAEVLTYKLINNFYNPQNSGFAFAVYDGSKDNKSLLYKSPDFETLGTVKGSRDISGQFSINNRRWTIAGTASPSIVPIRDQDRPPNTLWGGILLSVFLAVFIYTLLLNRTRALSDKEEQQLQSAKDELLALASHQLRTPATGVKQYIGMLREGYGGQLTPRQKKLLDQAYRSNERQLNTINDMLFVARADTGHIEFTMMKMDVLEFIEDILSEHRQIIKDKNQVLVEKLPKKPFYIWADKGYLRMAVENLLSNASKYTPPGGTVALTVKKTKGTVVISVEDTGVGIKQKYAHLLFQKFSRVPNDMTNQVSGSGIGLYLAKKVVDAHGGKIEFRSAPGKGSACIITLPIKRLGR